MRKMLSGQPTALRHTLELDIKLLMAKAQTDARQAKTIYGEPLPADLEECALKLQEMDMKKRTEIDELRAQIREIEAARHLVGSMQMNLDAVKKLDDAIDSLVGRPVSCAKKPSP